MALRVNPAMRNKLTADQIYRFRANLLIKPLEYDVNVIIDELACSNKDPYMK